jgi:hypothetical protein
MTMGQAHGIAKDPSEFPWAINRIKLRTTFSVAVRDNCAEAKLIFG